MNEYKPHGATLMLACLVAGPAFVLTYALAGLYLRLPQPMIVSPQDVLRLLGLSLPALLFGALLAAVPVTLGTVLMQGLGETSAAARPPLVWTLAGAAIGAGLASLFGALPAAPDAAFALVATSALCARICRRSAHWE